MGKSCAELSVPNLNAAFSQSKAPIVFREMLEKRSVSATWRYRRGTFHRFFRILGIAGTVGLLEALTLMIVTNQLARYNVLRETCCCKRKWDVCEQYVVEPICHVMEQREHPGWIDISAYQVCSWSICRGWIPACMTSCTTNLQHTSAHFIANCEHSTSQAL